MEVRHRLDALPAAQVGMDRVALDRARADDRDLDDQVVEVLRPRLAAASASAPGTRSGRRPRCRPPGSSGRPRGCPRAAGRGRRRRRSRAAMCRSASSMAESMPRPSRSSLMSLIVSTSRLSYWTTTRPGIVARSSGAMSISGAAVMSIPPMWIERWRGKPSMRAHSSSQRSQARGRRCSLRGRAGAIGLDARDRCCVGSSSPIRPARTSRSRGRCAGPRRSAAAAGRRAGAGSAPPRFPDGRPPSFQRRRSQRTLTGESPRPALRRPRLARADARSGAPGRLAASALSPATVPVVAGRGPGSCHSTVGTGGVPGARPDSSRSARRPLVLPVGDGNRGRAVPVRWPSGRRSASRSMVTGTRRDSGARRRRRSTSPRQQRSLLPAGSCGSAGSVQRRLAVPGSLTTAGISAGLRPEPAAAAVVELAHLRR